MCKSLMILVVSVLFGNSHVSVSSIFHQLVSNNLLRTCGELVPTSVCHLCWMFLDWYSLVSLLFSTGSGQNIRFASRLNITCLSLVLTLLDRNIPCRLEGEHVTDRVMLIDFLFWDDAMQIVLIGLVPSYQILCVSEVSSDPLIHGCEVISEYDYSGNKIKIVEDVISFKIIVANEDFREILDDTKVGFPLVYQVVIHESKGMQLSRATEEFPSKSTSVCVINDPMEIFLLADLQLDAVVSPENLFTTVVELRCSDFGSRAHPSLYSGITELSREETKPIQLVERLPHQGSGCSTTVLVNNSCPQASSSRWLLRKHDVGTNMFGLFVNMCFSSSSVDQLRDWVGSQFFVADGFYFSEVGSMTDPRMHIEVSEFTRIEP